jgi:3-oxoacyl-[acyl-carrier protein] reductase
VAPGFIDTDMTKALGEEQHAALLTRFRWHASASQRISPRVAFLASPQAAYITGTTLHVNGGMYMN